MMSKATNEKKKTKKATTNPTIEISVSRLAHATELNPTKVNVSCLPKWIQVKWKWLLESIDTLYDIMKSASVYK